MTAAAPMMQSSGPAEVSRIFDKFTFGFKIITPRLIISAAGRSSFILFRRFRRLPVELSVTEVEGDVDHHHRDVQIIEIIRQIEVAFDSLRRDAAEIAEADEQHEKQAFAFSRPCAQRAYDRERPGDAEGDYHRGFEYV
jgi:hypothetical protein